MDQNPSNPAGANVPAASPASTTPAAGGSVIGDLLRTLGVGQAHADEAHNQATSGDLNQQIDSAHKYVTEALQHARQYAQQNPSAVLGGLSALIIAAGMMRNHSGGR